ncbi:Glucose/arabinose dehydrogenase, beta-propeller fold [Actinopolyspora xinjiangensis]|uniref:Glucose/arabinose dehydrogenase, beta-propeller fold n=1 Tax=Actinopolyspora xinjiangensis TaxID=405564 RepID=A0A1H0USF9_9ACTN|nr:PQQ-dependent sugar dehydrogenase [Actinopolyspora xinjiangensis]SDP69229.1 Glucose/arabinose dehydrogenase, beta-propeller fold [Actinopolyspora xinjiangensis]
MRRRTGTVLLSLLLGAATLGSPAGAEPTGKTGSPTAGTARPDLTELNVTATRVDTDRLRRPTDITSASDGSGRMLIAEKPGTVRAYDPDSGTMGQPLLDITNRVENAGNEQGLLGIAPSPEDTGEDILYAAYTRASDAAVTLSRFSLAADDPAAGEEVLLSQPHSEHTNHNGGDLAFGPDGFLYMGIGDGGGAGDPLRSGQDLSTLLGKVLRIDVSRQCGEQPYCVPPDNPFAYTPGARGEIWSYGLRNPWRFSFDPEGRSLWIADVGQGSLEEVNRIPQGVRGQNFGWSCMEGTERFAPDRCEPAADYVEPVLTYQTSVEGCAVIGGRVYRGERYSDIADGTYLAADYCSAGVWGLRSDDGGHTYQSAKLGELPIQVTAFGADSSGELYVVNDLPGMLYRLSFSTDS